MNMEDKKLKELILYIAKRCESDKTFGSTKLNKILFYADFFAYGRTGKAITGQDYQKLEKGPAPKRLVPVRAELEKEVACATQTRDHYGFPQHRIIALREPDLSIFSGIEIAIVNQVIEEFKNRSAKYVSDLSHEFIGWQAAELNETIPYETALVSSRSLSESEKLHALRLEPTVVGKN